MKNQTSKIFILIAATVFFFSNISAQTTKNVREVFAAGEVLTYEGKLKTPGFPLVLSVADLKFSVLKTSDGKNILIKTDAKSKGTLIKLFDKSFIQQFESTVDAEKFRVLKTVKYDKQDERIRNSEAVFNYDEKKVTFIETDPQNPMRAPRRIASQIEPDTQDIVSAIYSLRRMTLTVGKVFNLSVSDSGLVYTIPVRVAAREQQDSILGKKMCFRLEPEIFGENRLIEQKGSMTIWMTDDENRIPVRSRIETNLGRVEVKLKKTEAENRNEKR